MSSHVHFFCTFDLTKRFVLFYEATKKVQQEVRESLNLVYRSGGEKRWNNLMETDPGSTIEKEQYLWIYSIYPQETLSFINIFSKNALLWRLFSCGCRFASIFLFVVGSHAPVRLLHKRPRKPSTTPQRWGLVDSKVSYGFCCPSYAACWNRIFGNFGLDPESFQLNWLLQIFKGLSRVLHIKRLWRFVVWCRLGSI